MTPLEALEEIKNAPTIYVGLASDIYTRFSYQVNVIEKSLKALEIIKEKRVNLGDFMRCESLTVEEYNDYFTYHEKEELTEEEFDLLKEILK